jgi:hypothetical protein
MLPAMPKSEIIRFDHKHTPTGKIARILRSKIERVRKTQNDAEPQITISNGFRRA